MNNHWDKNLNVRELVIRYKPKVVVELGAGDGSNSKQYLKLQKTQPFKFTVISDGKLPDDMRNMTGFKWIFGLSFLELPKFADKSIDFCSIDTDHNYWTLREELKILSKKMRPGGIVVIHDTESYKYNSGVMNRYNLNFPYPKGINKLQHIPYTQALDEMIKKGLYKIIEYCEDSCGATAIQKL